MLESTIACIAGVCATTCQSVPSLTSFVFMGPNIEVSGMNSDTNGSDDSYVTPDKFGSTSARECSDDLYVAPDKLGLTSAGEGSDVSYMAPDKSGLNLGEKGSDES